MDSITIKKLKCLRCGYEWYPKTEALPKKCAGCASRYWNKEKKDAKIDRHNRAKV